MDRLSRLSHTSEVQHNDESCFGLLRSFTSGELFVFLLQKNIESLCFVARGRNFEGGYGIRRVYLGKRSSPGQDQTANWDAST